MRQHLRILVLAITVAPAAFAEYTTPSVGGTGGNPFTILCPADKVLVGIRGGSYAYVDRVENLCVRVNTDGTWNGTPAWEGGVAGGSGGNAFELRCPANTAVSVIAGRSSNFVDKLQIGCNPLSSNGRLTGNWTMVDPAVGGNGGTAFGPSGHNCTDWRPARGFTGRSYSWLDKIALVCEFPSMTPVAPYAPVLTSPADGADFKNVGTKVDFNWEETTGATSYQLCLTRTNLNLTCATSADTKRWDNLTSSQMSVMATDLNGYFGRQLKWAVRACNNAGCTNSGTPRNLWLRFPNARLVSPAHNSTAANRRPTFKWTPNSDSEGYKLRYYSMTDPAYVPHDYDIPGGAVSEWTPTADLPTTGQIYWVVQVCKPMTSCGTGGSVAAGTAWYVTIPETVTPTGLGWTTQLNADILASIGHSSSTHLLNKSIKSIVNSAVSGRTDSPTPKMCAECHFAGASKNYQPNTTTSNAGGIEPNETITRFTSPFTSTYTWNQADPNGIIDQFCALVNHQDLAKRKPADLCAVFTKWRNDGYLP